MTDRRPLGTGTDRADASRPRDTDPVPAPRAARRRTPPRPPGRRAEAAPGGDTGLWQPPPGPPRALTRTCASSRAGGTRSTQHARHAVAGPAAAPAGRAQGSVRVRTRVAAAAVHPGRVNERMNGHRPQFPRRAVMTSTERGPARVCLPGSQVASQQQRAHLGVHAPNLPDNPDKAGHHGPQPPTHLPGDPGAWEIAERDHQHRPGQGPAAGFMDPTTPEALPSRPGRGTRAPRGPSPPPL